MRPLVLPLKADAMKAKARKPVIGKPIEGHTMKLQVDHKTIIVVRTQKALDMWMERYPKAQLMA